MSQAGRPYLLKVYRYGGVLVLAIVTFQLARALDSHRGIVFYPDSRGYLFLSSHSIGNLYQALRAFAVRPILPQIFFAILGRGPMMVDVQIGVSVCSWSYLAWELWRRATLPAVGVMVAFLVGSAAVSANIVAWNTALLSESLALSTLAVAIGLLLSLERTYSKRKALVAVAVILTLPLIRDSYIWSAPFMLAALIALRTGETKRSFNVKLVVGGATTGVLEYLGYVGVGGANPVGRYPNLVLAPLNDDMGTRILRSSLALAFFERHGLDPTGQLLRCSGRNLCNGGDTYLRWARTHLAVTYAQWLLSRPLYALGSFIRAFPTYESSYRMGETYTGRLHGANLLVYLSLHLPIGQGSWVMTFLLVSIGTALMAIVAVKRGELVVARGSLSEHLLLPAVLLVGFGVSLFLDYWGDSQEIWRHSLESVVGLEVSAVLLLVGGLNLLWSVPTTGVVKQAGMRLSGRKA